MQLEYHAASAQSIEIRKMRKKRRATSTTDYYIVMAMPVQHQCFDMTFLVYKSLIAICSANLSYRVRGSPSQPRGTSPKCAHEAFCAHCCLPTYVCTRLPTAGALSRLSESRLHSRSRFTNSSRRALPSPAGERSTTTPALSSALILESAPPLPPDTMAPA